MPKKNLRQLELIRQFLESKGQKIPQKEEGGVQDIGEEKLASSDECYWDYSTPLFKGDERLSCQHRSRSGELLHRELLLVVPNTGLLKLLGKEGKLRGKALEEYNGQEEH